MKTYPETKEMAKAVLPSALTPTTTAAEGGVVADPAAEKDADRTKIIIWLVLALVGGVLAGKYLWK